LKLKKQLYEKIKFKKLLSVFKTDKIANLHGHEAITRNTDEDDDI
jgi:hypothetical protein